MQDDASIFETLVGLFVFFMRSIGILITWNDIWVVRSTSFPWVTQHLFWSSDDRRRYNHVWYTDIQLKLTGFGLTIPYYTYILDFD